MHATAVILERPGAIALGDVVLNDPTDKDVVVDIELSGISTGTEKLLWSGRMPSFPGMGYPLVPGYESVGRVVEAGQRSGRRVGDRVFVPGAACYRDVRGLFGGAASRVVVPGRRVAVADETLGSEAVLLALAATAYHAVSPDTRRPPQLVVGHGVLGRLVARIAVATGVEDVTVWETDPARRAGAEGYRVTCAEEDDRRDYSRICDVSGNATVLDTLVSRMSRRGEVVLAGFYEGRIDFAFAPAFMREASFRIAAEWRPSDLQGVRALLDEGRLSLDGLITHRSVPADVDGAYRSAFTDPGCLKMILDWRQAA